MIKEFKDLTGQRYGRLTVIRLNTKRSSSRMRTTWVCKCDCGNEKIVRSDSLGKINSCGCLKKEQDTVNISDAIDDVVDFLLSIDDSVTVSDAVAKAVGMTEAVAIIQIQAVLNVMVVEA